MEELREKSSKDTADLTSTLESEREGHGNHLAATADLEDQSRVSQSSITKLQEIITKLAETKAEIDDDMNDATNAIAMLEDELDRKDAQVKELLIKLTITMLLENGTSVERWMDIAMDGEISSDGNGQGDGSSDGRGNRSIDGRSDQWNGRWIKRWRSTGRRIE